MSGCPFCPHQRCRTFFLDLWEQMLPQSSCCLLSRLCPPLPPQVCLYCGLTFPWRLCSLSFYDLFDFLQHLLCHPPWPKGHDYVMVREEPGEFGIIMLAQPLLWACLGERPWEEEGNPFHPLKYNIPFWGPSGLYLPREKKTCYQPSPLMYRAFMVVIGPFIHTVLFELACFFWWNCLKCLRYRIRRQGTSSVSVFIRVAGIQVTVLFPSLLAMGSRRESQCHGDTCHHSVSPHWDANKGRTVTVSSLAL
jgi:hypothetical protein